MSEREEVNAKDIDKIYIGPAIDEIKDFFEKLMGKLPSDYHIDVHIYNKNTYIGEMSLIKKFDGKLPRLDLDDLSWDGKEYIVIK